MSSIRAEYFGRAAFGVIIGLSSMITTFGNTFGPVVAGALAERTGRYETGLTVLAVLAGLGSVFFVLATRPRPPRRQTAALTNVADADPVRVGLL